ncbi:multiple sugar transport system permease protein/lactose/L-arabinose transport system permease protein/cellobiose transport system permease protein [Paenibacillus anaericanus]|uniref:carbohydrate ABC transporter permease n=1 Tax=Paenibacillus anaericanus TaxID=170367 RepID=UPI00278B228E|nr:carbohydrate ABC transporter permease [Paenibacillus anaericanus]MDQ0090403.1 multiple sugar transport system permease protein/lactose/L-arabinose transport system permease protein/cellobiose transport system permease protein [Paenibacillus anaericanus]
MEKTLKIQAIDTSNSKSIWSSSLAFILMALASLLTMFPLFWLFSSSLKDISEIFVNPPIWVPSTLHWENFRELFVERKFGIITWNSFLLASTSTLIALIFCGLAGFAFAKYQFKGKNFLFVLVLASLMIPHEATMVPLFSIYKNLNLIDNIWGVILPDLANAFGIFFMRQYCMSLPDEMMEAARIDGCTEFKLFRRIVLPNLRSGFAGLGIILFVKQWNNFLWPSVILRSQENMTLSVALKALEDSNNTPYHLIMAGSVISVVPLLIIVLIFQKQLIAGMIEGAVKG